LRIAIVAEDDRLNELEIRMAYLEDSMATLDTVVARQADYISRLETAHKTLFNRLKSLQERIDDPASAGGEPPPPHY
jgi:SlyX protein